MKQQIYQKNGKNTRKEELLEAELVEVLVPQMLFYNIT